ncbi:MAG TPA: phosphatase PAP2 family protein [Pseudolabrys sp.]|jgi:membrane-associated phospholipid phosphatase
MTSLQRWFLSLAGTAVASAASIEWLDRPIALISREHIAHRDTFASLTHIPDPLIPVAVVVFVAIGLWAFAAWPLARWQVAALLSSISVIVAETTKSELKYVFGRTWPDTWVANNPSFLRDGAYGFNFFHGGAGYASFPSGHTAVTCAIASVLWIYYPRLRALWALGVLAVAVGLLGANYHFLGDIIAGGFVGASTGWMTVTLWNTRFGKPTPPQA